MYLVTLVSCLFPRFTQFIIKPCLDSIGSVPFRSVKHVTCERKIQNVTETCMREWMVHMIPV